ncbi:hypothetical protein HYH03_005396 [Edaphochlamys debaryana]|uniref:Uncharacterized protein n=1 Tax=Edaphochlamys debaryana TaxID=47281 RepID=A0A835Y7J0_9CHLO|nr:hypothetical protein HYH03_005396 [Edaphochlamys debaryana]|eukprot:KAG2496574.1 hypothetical protein HYH03_005396 [Edaphochlamys debaryana]
MKASDWAKVVADPELASKVILIKTSFPTVNVEVLLDRHPRTLLWSLKLLQSNIEQVAPVLGALPRPEKVLETLPELLDPRQCFSVVASIRKWYTKRDPLEVLQMDPEVIRRAERVDVPLEPVFLDPATGIWTAAGYSREKQEEWQVYIEQKVYKRKPQPIDKMTVLKVGGSPVAAGAAEGEGPTVADAAAVAAALGLMPLPLPAGEGLEVAVSEAPAEEAGPRQGAAAAGLAGQGQVAGP